jgi:transcriptional regulator with XRE-family HTH domain
MSIPLPELLARRPAKMPLAQLARLAGMHPGHLAEMVAGRRPPTEASLARIRMALMRLRSRATEGPLAEFCLYQALLARAAAALGLEVALVRASGPADKIRTPQARAAAQARWLAFYLMNVGYGVTGAMVARAAGVSKNAVSLALQEVELRRDTDAAFARLLEDLETELVGGL